jgi:DNA helicase-2/ATP-dependent DNA helicase PcrA
MKNSFNENFTKLYKQLNVEQKEAVDAIEGPVIVVAGPGTGKTHLLSMHIANILDKTDASPEAILALTFTESGVASMRKKLARIIGSDAYSVSINTFHGFCNETIKDNPDEFLNIIGAENITEVEQIEILEEILTASTFKFLRPFGDNYYYIRPVIHCIGELKKEGVTSE